jgi:hypothetical protein
MPVGRETPVTFRVPLLPIQYPLQAESARLAQRRWASDRGAVAPGCIGCAIAKTPESAWLFGALAARGKARTHRARDSRKSPCITGAPGCLPLWGLVGTKVVLKKA